MPKNPDLRAAERRGSIAAIEELLDLDIDRTRQIDVFSAIERKGVWLMFRPLGTSLGLFLRGPEASGVLINSHRPRSVQRLTAAHEYGHLLLGHKASLDDVRAIDGVVDEVQEAEAQAFAMGFVMPLELVEAEWTALDLPDNSDDVTSHEAYQLALSMGVSYRACVVQLRAMEKLTRSAAQQLLRYKPQAIKKSIGRGIGPEDPWADVWPVEEADSGRLLDVRLRDEIRLTLAERPSTGYRWMKVDSLPPNALELVSDEFEGSSGPEGAVGAGGHRFLSYKATGLGAQSLSLGLSRSWSSANPTREFSIRLNVSENEDGGERTGLRKGVQELVLAGGS